ncbi:unnamed protein product [Bursaphelenchus xylophilus]|uniref:(pine wood nematode) hypothetical protein n=1 Tax=Bursaphelenchus xylophilus TaxID=6326 RepID=A0A1I7S5I6_BURXY|nr:unnamed protein product [Bursaphelenchus xylophilus]CAG9124748.1 unnamed protein product [Bursaphelenchus xylophilus]
MTIILNYYLIRHIKRLDKKVDEITTQNALILSSYEYEGEFCVIRDYWDPDIKAFPRTSITLTTHAAVEFADFIDEHEKTWTGPISVAIMVPNPMYTYNASGQHDFGTEQSVNYAFSYALAKLELLQAKKANRISLNLMYKKDDKCHETLKVPLVRLKENPEFIRDSFNLVRRFAGYPANYLRNLARYGSKTNLIFATEIENFPSDDFEEKMRPLANELLVHSNRKSLLLIREFEVTLGVEIPKNRTILRKFYNDGFVIESYTMRRPSMNHKLPYLKEWLETAQTKIVPFKVIPYQGNDWEPAFVTYRKALPKSPVDISDVHQDSRFQVEEACRAGFDFVIVNDLFTVHAGFRKTADRMIEGARNDTLREMLTSYKKFQARLDQQYPNTKPKCPERPSS